MESINMFKYLTNDNSTSVFALTTNLDELLRIRKKVFFPASLNKLPIHEDSITRNWKGQAVVCNNTCPLTVDEKVTVIFSGPLTSHASKIAKLEEILAIMKTTDGSAILDGFPAGPNSQFANAAT